MDDEKLGNSEQPEDTSVQLASPIEPKSRKKLIIIILIVLLVIAGVAAGWYLTRDKETAKISPVQPTSANEDTDKEMAEPVSQLKTSTYESALYHKPTVSFEHPADWKVTIGETSTEGADGLKRMTIGSAKGNYLHVFDRDGIGGYCDPDLDAYTLTKEIITKTKDMIFKEYNAPTKEHLNKLFILETENREWSVPAHDALTEGQSLSNTCNIGQYSSIGSSGVFVIINNSAEDRTVGEGVRRLGWDDIKDDIEFVRMLESMNATEKSL